MMSTSLVKIGFQTSNFPLKVNFSLRMKRTAPHHHFVCLQENLQYGQTFNEITVTFNYLAWRDVVGEKKEGKKKKEWVT